MFIVIVGPDGAGKTTLTNQLVKQTGFETMKWNKPKDEEEKDRMFQDYCQVLVHKNNIIFDRFVYCEQVYGTIMRDKSQLSYSDICHIEYLLSLKGAIIIHCTDELDILWERCVARGESYITDKETLGKIKDGYHQLFKTQRNIPVVEYKVKSDD